MWREEERSGKVQEKKNAPPASSFASRRSHLLRNNISGTLARILLRHSSVQSDKESSRLNRAVSVWPLGSIKLCKPTDSPADPHSTSGRTR